VGAAPVRVVEHEHVTFMHVFRADALHGLLRREFHRCEVNRAIGRLTQQLQVGVINRIRKVEHIRQDRRERRPLEYRRHPVGSELENAAHHLESDRIDVDISMISFLVHF